MDPTEARESVLFAGKASYVPNPNFQSNLVYFRDTLARQALEIVRAAKSKLEPAILGVRVPPTFFDQLDERSGRFSVGVRWDGTHENDKLLDLHGAELAAEHARIGLITTSFEELHAALLAQLQSIPKDVGTESVILVGGPPDRGARQTYCSIGLSGEPTPGHYECPRCHSMIPNDHQNATAEGWITCPNYEHGPVFFTDDLSLTGLGFDDGVHQLERSQRHFKLYRQLLSVAQRESVGWFGLDWTAFRNPSEQVFVAVANQQVVGYARWNRFDGHRCLRQLFVKSRSRRQGIATQLIRAEAEKAADHYFVESPNELSVALLIKLGHIERDGDKLLFKKARIIWSA